VSLPAPVNTLIALLAKQAVKGYFASETQRQNGTQPDRSNHPVQTSRNVDYAE